MQQSCNSEKHSILNTSSTHHLNIFVFLFFQFMYTYMLVPTALVLTSYYAVHNLCVCFQGFILYF